MRVAAVRRWDLNSRSSSTLRWSTTTLPLALPCDTIERSGGCSRRTSRTSWKRTQRSSWARSTCLRVGCHALRLVSQESSWDTRTSGILFPLALALAKKLKPRAVMLENVRGLIQPRFKAYRDNLDRMFEEMGYRSTWKLLQASDFGVPQLRPRVVCVALRTRLFARFSWENVKPIASNDSTPTVGVALRDLMAADGWTGVEEWITRANKIAPTLVGGSKKHGGPDLGPTRAKRAWAEMGVNAHGLADAPPSNHHHGAPKLTVQMAAVLQGFPPAWKFVGGKTGAYRQVGNAFPPPVAAAVARAIYDILRADGRGHS